MPEFGATNILVKLQKQENEMEIESRIYLCVDSHGNKAYAVCGDSSDTVQICGMKTPLGGSIYFESEAYHLSTWCAENSIQLQVTTRTEKFSDLWATRTLEIAE